MHVFNLSDEWLYPWQLSRGLPIDQVSAVSQVRVPLVGPDLVVYLHHASDSLPRVLGQPYPL